MSEELDFESKQSKPGSNEEVISQRRGKIVFAFTALFLSGIFIYFGLTTNHSKIPTPIVSSSPSEQPTRIPTPSISHAPSLETNIPVGIGIVIAGQLSNRNWTFTADNVIQKISNYIDSAYLPIVTSKIKAWDWAQCLKIHCIIGAEIGKTTIVTLDSNNLDITQTMLRYKNYNKPLPSDTWHIHMMLESDGQWRATAISGPGF